MMRSSFRDPEGCAIQVDGKIFRFVLPSGMDNFSTTINSPVVKKSILQKKFISFSVVDKPHLQALLQNPKFSDHYTRYSPSIVLEHPKIAFPSFPYEWAPEMLHQSALLTLNLAESLLSEGLGIKDATPYNVLFDGSQPVFVDFTSVEKRIKEDPVWLPYAQFIRTFLFPLLLHKKRKISLQQIFTSRKEGPSLEEMYDYLGSAVMTSKQGRSLVFFPFWSSRLIQMKSLYHPRKTSPQLAAYILQSLWKRCRRSLRQLQPEKSISIWSNYMKEKTHYSDEDFSTKESFVTNILEKFPPKKVLDIGCNTGHFSLLAGKKGIPVVAVDLDSQSIGNLWTEVFRKNLPVLPLVVNFCQPTPSLGWKNEESLSFLDRCKGQFDMIFFLAILHHVMVTERVPLHEIASLLSNMTSDGLIIEFVPKEDPKFQEICRGRESLFAFYTKEKFIEEFSLYFDICHKQDQKDGGRCLFFMKKKQSIY